MSRLQKFSRVALFSLICGVISGQPAPPGPDALQVYKSGDYATAISLLMSSQSKDQEAVVRSALLSSLVYQGQVDEAVDLADNLAARFPNVPEALTARAELLYYLGDILAADKLFSTALQLNPQSARANLGLYRILRAAGFYRSARLSCLRAHSLDPDDALITLAFMSYLVPDKVREELGPFMQAHPWFAKNYERDAQFRSDVAKELTEHKAFEFEGARQETTLHLVDLLYGPNRVRGVGLEVSVEGNRPLRLLLDTGASGVIISQRAADKAGLKHIGSSEAWGIGDGGVRKTFAAFASVCKIGSLEFKNCAFQSLEGRKIAGDEDGLIGADFFADYLIHLDFQRRLMNLTPLPERSANPQGYDRMVPTSESDFTPIFRFRHMLMIPTKVNGKSSGLFALDTGSDLSIIDSSFARISTKLRGNDYMKVHGLSGKVNDVLEADKAELEFGRFRQRNLGLISLNLNNSPRHEEVRMSGILGLAVLAMFRLDLDYRNNLVKFDYVLK